MTVAVFLTYSLCIGASEALVFLLTKLLLMLNSLYLILGHFLLKFIFSAKGLGVQRLLAAISKDLTKFLGQKLWLHCCYCK